MLKFFETFSKSQKKKIYKEYQDSRQCGRNKDCPAYFTERDVFSCVHDKNYADFLKIFYLTRAVEIHKHILYVTTKVRKFTQLVPDDFFIENWHTFGQEHCCELGVDVTIFSLNAFIYSMLDEFPILY